MRVITGTARGRKLETRDGLDVRPTTEIVKEAVFSMIHFRLPAANVAARERQLLLTSRVLRLRLSAAILQRPGWPVRQML